MVPGATRVVYQFQQRCSVDRPNTVANRKPYKSSCPCFQSGPTTIYQLQCGKAPGVNTLRPLRALHEARWCSALHQLNRAVPTSPTSTAVARSLGSDFLAKEGATTRRPTIGRCEQGARTTYATTSTGKRPRPRTTNTYGVRNWWQKQAAGH